MGAGRQYCGECFELFDDGLTVCPHCGATQAALSYRDYRQKLVHALEHPLADVRMRAIVALGLRGEANAAEALVDCALRTPTDLVAGLEVVLSLERILAGTGKTAPLSRLTEQHPASAVKTAAMAAALRLA